MAYDFRRRETWRQQSGKSRVLARRIAVLLAVTVLVNRPPQAQAQMSWATITLQNLDDPTQAADTGENGINTVISDANMLLYSGIRYQLTVTQPISDGQLDVAGGSDLRFKLVDQDASDCTSLLDERYVKGSFAEDGAAGYYEADTGGAGGFIITVNDEFEVRMGGYYKFCFSTNGIFTGTQAVPIPITMKFKGVYDYVSTGLLAEREYNCYLRKKAYYGYNSYNGKYSSYETSCRVWFAYSTTAEVGYMLPDADEKGSWSAEFGLDLSTREVETKECADTAPATFICRVPETPGGAGACTVGSRLIQPIDVDERTVRFPTVTNTLEDAAYRARSVAACYCPGYDSCDAQSDFVQQIGIMHFYISKVCDPGTVGCDTDYTGVTPQYRFKVLIQCPGDACRTTQTTRMKIISTAEENDYPSWMSDSGCREGQHGIVLRGTRQHQALGDYPFDSVGPYMPFAPPVSPATTNPDCDSTTGCLQSGYGTISGDTSDYQEQDFKEFGGTAGFQFIMGNTNHEARNFYDSYSWDTCFCRGNCDTPANWFKTGSIRLSPTRLLSSATATSNLPSQWSIEFTNQAGIVGVYKSYDDEYTLGLQDSGMLVKILSDQLEVTDTPANMDYKCYKNGYDSQLISGPSDASAASFNYAGETVAPEATRVIFNSGYVARTITSQEGGRVAICYCARIDDDGLCADGGDLSMNWRMLAQLTIKGPRLLPQQLWEFSTNVVFRFSYLGYGLTSYDSLRIIDFSGSCDDDNYNPDRAAYSYTYMKVGCPDNCKEVSRTNGNVPGDLSTRVRTSECATFGRNNGDCVRNDIEEVYVISESQTELVFQSEHGMADGDEITLGDNFYCKSSTTNNPCTDETIAALKGLFDFADVDDQDYQAPSTYMKPHLVSTVSGEPTKLRISIGWPEPVPEFEVIFSGTDPDRPDIIGEGGQWIHHTEGFTKEEIMGEVARANMKVCWSFGRPEVDGTKYVEQVGLLTITDPAEMEGATVSISTLKLGQAAPMILQFTTSTGEQTGAKYDEAEDSTRLKILFTAPALLDMHKADLSATEIGYDEVVEYEDATQQICGQLFLELWSEDMERGFPLPKGCYYRSFDGTSPSREIVIIFEPLNGLRKGTQYQIVFNGHIQDVLHSVTAELLEDTFMEIIPMDDVTARPYEAIERGVVTLDSDARIPKPDSIETSPEFNSSSGFKIVGGYDNLLELETGDTLSFEIMGGTGEGNMITAGCHIRIFMWPFTQWMTTSSCTAGCIEVGESSFQCDTIQCQAEAMVTGMTLNIIKLTLGEIDGTWGGFGELFGDTKARIRVGAITMPGGGFFAERLAAQVTDGGVGGNSDLGDRYPHYVISTGDFVWKAPTEGQTVAKVISISGGGNTKPYRQDADNVLYARLILASTLLARDDTGEDASFTITLPEGYSCLQPETDAAVNYWEAETTLEAFDGVLPQGRGTPDDKSANHGWKANGRNCTFTPFHPYGVVYAGSSLVVKITVDNPTEALQRSDTDNFLTFVAASRGLCGTSTCVRQGDDRPYTFLASGSTIYQSNNVVLGKITSAYIQPTMFTLKGVRDSSQEIMIFFKTEQEIAGGGSILLLAPPGFDFGSPCEVGDLEDSYYATESNPSSATLRLPVSRTTDVITFTCNTTTSTNDDGDKFQTITVGLDEILEGGRWVGFKATVNNPSDATLWQTEGWLIYTADSSGYIVDGTPDTVPFIAGNETSWGLYAENETGFSGSLSVTTQSDLTINGAVVADMRPYSMTNAPIYITLTVSKLPTKASGAVRLALPDTYLFDFTSQPLIFRAASDSLVQTGFEGYAAAAATAPFPPCVVVSSSASTCPYEMADDSTLTFLSATFRMAETYGLSFPVRIPDFNPIHMSNSIFLELGWDEASVSKRVAALSFDLPNVRSLKNAEVDYTTSITGKETALQFTLETVTPIPEAGFIQILAPSGFNFSNDCYLMSSEDPDAEDPPDLTCVHTSTTSGPRIRLSVPEGATLAAGKHNFAILAENPQSLNQNSLSSGTTCGTSVCWRFSTYRYLSTGALQQLDKGTAARGYSINARMLEARMPTLTSTQTYSTKRDDRPGQLNNVILAFQLTSSISEDGEIVVRTPFGFLFNQECFDSVDTKESTLFGYGNRFPDDYEVWPTGVEITSCRGNGREATLNFTVASGSSLAASTLYVFRIGNLTNPASTPSTNEWVLTFSTSTSGQASEAITGLSLWTFTGTTLEAVATAKDQTLAGETRTKNPLRFTFTPYNNVPLDGELRVEAPDGFTFVHLTSLECTASLTELPYIELGVSYAGYEWSEDVLSCLTDENDASKVTVSLGGTRAMLAGLEYELILYVYNAATESSTPASWTVQSYQSGDLPLDESAITGFVVNPVMTFQYTNDDPSNPGTEVTNGLETLPDFVMMMQFPDELSAGDRIVIIVPTDFMFTTYSGACSNFRWVCSDETQDCEGELEREPVCNSTEQTITFHITNYPAVAAETLIQFGMDFVNPARTMDLAENLWRCTHYGPTTEKDLTRGLRYRETTEESTLPIYSSKAFVSWDIIPQLEDVSVTLLDGENMAAGATSGIVVTFTAVNDAEDVAIQFSSPLEFNFDKAYTVVADGETAQAVVGDTGGNLVRVRTTILAGNIVTITLKGVVLGTGGGQTTVQITTWTDGIMQNSVWDEGTAQDERLSCAAGCSFILPGQVDISYQTLQNTYHQSPLLYPVQSEWEAQTGRPAKVEFQFSLTVAAKVGHELWIYGLPYQPTVQEFSLATAPSSSTTSSDDADARAISCTIKEVASRILKITLDAGLATSTVYEVIFAVVAPTAAEVAAHAGEITWTIETWAYPYGALPTNTNDGESREFPLVEQYTFQVYAARVPPTAEVEITLYVKPGLDAPTSLLIVAPLSFNFSSNCLVSGGAYVESCYPTADTTDGRKTATLALVDTGLTAATSDIIIKATAPSAEPSDISWFIEGRDSYTDTQYGWGEATGLEIEQMAETTVIYPAVPGLDATMVVRFQTQVLIESGGWLEISLPAGMEPSCSGNQFDPFAIPDTGTCRVVDDTNVIVTLNSTMVPGEYAFALQVTPPSTVPIRNTIDVILKDRDGVIRDAAVDIDGIEIQDKLKIQATELVWTQSKALRESLVTVGFSITDTMPDLVVSDTQQISEILIVFPVGFVHLVDEETDFVVLNEDMPFADSWIDYMQKDRLRVILDLNQSTTWTTLQPGTYRFRFPVLVPSPLPVFNVWFVSLCSPNYPEGCSTISDPAVLINFPLPGFEIGETYSGASLTGGAFRRTEASLPALLLAIALSLSIACFGPR